MFLGWRHAEFEECLSQEKFVQELKQALNELQTPAFQYADLRRDQPDPDEVIRQRLGEDRSRTSTHTGERTGLLSQLSYSSPQAGIMFPTTSHAPSYATASTGSLANTDIPRNIASPNVSEPAGEPAVMSNPVTPTRPMTFDNGNSEARSSRDSPREQEVHYVQAKN